MLKGWERQWSLRSFIIGSKLPGVGPHPNLYYNFETLSVLEYCFVFSQFKTPGPTKHIIYCFCFNFSGILPFWANLLINVVQAESWCLHCKPRKIGVAPKNLIPIINSLVLSTYSSATKSNLLLRRCLWQRHLVISGTQDIEMVFPAPLPTPDWLKDEYKTARSSWKERKHWKTCVQAFCKRQESCSRPTNIQCVPFQAKRFLWTTSTDFNVQVVSLERIYEDWAACSRVPSFVLQCKPESTSHLSTSFLPETSFVHV